MEKDELLQALSNISDVYFKKKDYTSANMINRAMDVVNDYQGVLIPQPNVIKSVCVCKNRQDQFKRNDIWICGDCEEEIKQNGT